MVRLSWVLLIALLVSGCLTKTGAAKPRSSDAGSTGEAAPTASSLTPEQLVAQYVREQIGGTWAGDCDRTNILTDTGKYCAKLGGEREGMHAYRIGRTFAEPTHWIFIDQVDGAWRIAAIEAISTEDIAPGVPWPLKIGAQVVVTGTGSCLNIRVQPRTDAPVLTCLKDGQEVTIAEGPRVTDGRRWWLLDGFGWAVDSYLRYPDAVPSSRR